MWRMTGISALLLLVGGCSAGEMGEFGTNAARALLHGACNSLGNCSNVCADGTEAVPPDYSCRPGVRRPDLGRPKGL